MKKILITGGAGFIGTNFVKKIALPRTEFEFHILDSLTYASEFKNIEKNVEQNSHLFFHRIDIRNKGDIDKVFCKYAFDGVIHFAAESHVDNSIENPNVFVETNVLGTMNLLNAALSVSKNKKTRFLQISTDEVYGSLAEDETPFTETSYIKPSSPYSASKASADLLVLSYVETYGLDAVITRCSNNYGPYQHKEKLIPLMISNAKNGVALPIYGDGRNIRDWIHVDDHNKAVWEVFQDGKAGEIYNLGGNSERRNIEIVKIILNELKKDESLISFVEDRLGHDWRYAIDFSKAEKELNWKPEITFEEGIESTIDWYLNE